MQAEAEMGQIKINNNNPSLPQEGHQGAQEGQADQEVQTEADPEDQAAQEDLADP